MAMAISASVTVSMGLLTNGVFSSILRVSLDLRHTSFAAKSMKPGRMLKSLQSAQHFNAKENVDFTCM